MAATTTAIVTSTELASADNVAVDQRVNGSRMVRLDAHEGHPSSPSLVADGYEAFTY